MRRFLLLAAMLALGGLTPALAQKTLNIGMAAADVGQLDPHKATTTQDKPVVSWIFNGLVRLKPGTHSRGKVRASAGQRKSPAAARTPIGPRRCWPTNRGKGSSRAA